MESRDRDRAEVGINQSTLGELFRECGHVYVTAQGYVHIHFYCGEEVVADYIARRLSARVRPHLKIYDVVVSNRKDLAVACKELLKYPMSEGHRHVLRKALDYALAKDRLARHGQMLDLREYLREQKAASQLPLPLPPSVP